MDSKKKILSENERFNKLKIDFLFFLNKIISFFIIIKLFLELVVELHIMKPYP